MALVIQRIEDLQKIDCSRLIQESEAEGYRFVRRLCEDYNMGRNRFDKQGEALFGVWNESDELIAIGGVNQSPFSDSGRIGRLRRFYVRPDSRRQGIGTMLLREITEFSKGNFDEMTLRTDSAKSDAFYRANGFMDTDQFPESTHKMLLQ
ncbi:GNAT family N-acetyltransferase [Chungangia koreensis]|uniref:GNAT family N-acetyltransferase n=1 Tax=Chungangia koreensis TaxID=752657 RepID=A0ABV8X1M7_9LACT